MHAAAAASGGLLRVPDVYVNQVRACVLCNHDGGVIICNHMIGDAVVCMYLSVFCFSVVHDRSRPAPTVRPSHSISPPPASLSHHQPPRRRRPLLLRRPLTTSRSSLAVIITNHRQGHVALARADFKSAASHYARALAEGAGGGAGGPQGARSAQVGAPGFCGRAVSAAAWWFLVSFLRGPVGCAALRAPLFPKCLQTCENSLKTRQTQVHTPNYNEPQRTARNYKHQQHATSAHNLQQTTNSCCSTWRAPTTTPTTSPPRAARCSPRCGSRPQTRACGSTWRSCFRRRRCARSTASAPRATRPRWVLVFVVAASPCGGGVFAVLEGGWQCLRGREVPGGAARLPAGRNSKHNHRRYFQTRSKFEIRKSNQSGRRL